MLILCSIFLIVFLIVFIFIIKMMKENSQKVILAIYLIVVLSIILFLVWFIFSGNAINYKPFYGPTTIQKSMKRDINVVKSLQSNNFTEGEISETLQKVASKCQPFLYCGAWVLRGIQGGACAPLTSGYLHQIRRYLASKYRACQTLLVSFVESTFKGTFTLRTIRPQDVLKGWDL